VGGSISKVFFKVVKDMMPVAAVGVTVLSN
jgi:hypothetical protein